MPIETGHARSWLHLLLLCCALLWAPRVVAQTLESVLAPGPVIQGHAKVEHECAQCHSRFDRSGQDALCVVCHKEVGEDIRRHQGLHGRREGKAACRTCHGEHKGRNAQLAAFDQKTFDHKVTDFELRDKHLGIECTKCHVPGKRWAEAPSACLACHGKDDVHKGGMGRECADCHSAKTWKGAVFDHDKTHFPLTFKHAEIKCEDCHPKARYKDTPRTCIGCHKKDDDHKGQYGEKCETCHGAKAWKPSIFNHDRDTRYLLKERHRMVKCASCHTGPIYTFKLGQACVDCHSKDDKHEGTLGRKCADCHTERGWKDSPVFDHDKSRFPLREAHRKVVCKDCHADTLFRKTPSQCVACHLKDDRHQKTLGEDCASCHTERNWKTTSGRFDHNKTRFPLRNAHAARSVKCADCHESARAYRKTPTDCASCHRRDDRHEGTLGARCDECHRDVSWRIERFDHTRTRYPLLGGHQAVRCAACHLTQRYREAKSDCVSCHRKDDKVHNGTLGTDCARCHNARAWSLWDFDHDKVTNYVLDGSHKTVRCIACHDQPAPSGKAIAAVGRDCVSCHRKNDVHEGRFGRRCETCHTTDNWRRVRQATGDRARPSASGALQ